MASDTKKPALKGKKTDELPSFEVAYAAARKKYGSNTITMASDLAYVERVPFGIPSLDFQLGGGAPMERILHVSGDFHSGKTFLAMMLAAALQKAYPNKSVFWLDEERSFEPNRAEHVGIDPSKVILCRPASSEVGLDELIDMSPYISGAVIDSVAAMASTAEVLGAMGDKQVGQVAAMMSKFFHKWISETSPEKIKGIVPMLVLTNQLRDDIGAFVKRTKTPGGRCMLHYPSVFLELSRGALVKLKEHDAEGEEVVIGHDIKFKIRKNNTFQPDKKGSFMLCTRPYDLGGYQLMVNQVDWPRDLLKYAVHYGVVERNGAWHEFSDVDSGNVLHAQGRLAAQAQLYNDGNLTAEIYELTMQEVRRQHGIAERKHKAKLEKTGKAISKAKPRKKSSWVRK